MEEMGLFATLIFFILLLLAWSGFNNYWNKGKGVQGYALLRCRYHPLIKSKCFWFLRILWSAS